MARGAAWPVTPDLGTGRHVPHLGFAAARGFAARSGTERGLWSLLRRMRLSLFRRPTAAVADAKEEGGDSRLLEVTREAARWCSLVATAQMVIHFVEKKTSAGGATIEAGKATRSSSMPSWVGRHSVLGKPGARWVGCG
ncbi:hypothetical protein ACP4OV_014117 [Aristida adscensionis]